MRTTVSTIAGSTGDGVIHRPCSRNRQAIGMATSGWTWVNDSSTID